MGPSFTVERAALLAELAHMGSVLLAKTSIPILSHVLIEAHKDGLRLKATDLDTSIITELDAGVATNGAVALPGDKLKKLVASFPGDVTFEAEKDNWSSVKSGSATARIAGLGPEDFPAIDAFGNGKGILSVPGGALLHAIKATRYAGDDVDAAPGALLKLDGKALVFVTVERHRLAYYQEPCEGGPLNVMVPRKAMLAMEKLLQPEALVDVKDHENRLMLRLGRRVLTQRKIDGTFPNYEQVVKDQVGKREVLVPREPLIAALKRTLIFATRSPVVVLEEAVGALRVYSELHDGSTSDVVPADGDTSGLKFGVNSTYALDACGALNTEKVRLFFHTGKDTNEMLLALKPGVEEGSEQIHVIMPCRL